MEISTHGVLNIISLIKSRPVPDSFRHKIVESTNLTN